MKANEIRQIIIFMIMSLSHPTLFAQLTPFPGVLTINNQAINSGTHRYSHPATIISPDSPNDPVMVSGTAGVLYESATEIILKNGFEAHSFTGNGHFLGRINPDLDMFLVTPDPSTAIVNGQVHVPKWEKLEIALKLPAEYQTAINSFFAHYYSNSPVIPTTDLNPYAFDSLEVRFDLVKPDGVTQLSRWAFFIKPAKWADPLDPCSEPADDDTSIMGEYPFRFRFAPNELSNGIPWTFNITIRNPQNLPGFPQYHFTGFEFYCDAPLANNHGYLEVASNNQFLKFEDGTPFLESDTI